MKSLGRHEAAHRMQPSRQRLEADDLALGDGLARHRLRLIMQRQLAVLDREREILVQHAAIADLLVHLRLVDADRAARFRLGAEQRRAGIGEQRGGIRAVVREYRDAGGDAGANRFAVDLELAGQRLGKLLGQCHAGGGLLAVDDQSELVAGQPGHDAAARRGLDAARHLDQQLVADRMAEHVVDFLQAVEVDRQHREFLVGAVAGLDHLRQRLQERGAVRQIGQAVVIGHVGHARFGLAAIGDVLVGLDQILRLAGIVEHRHAAGQEQPQAVLGADRVFFGEQAALPDRRLVARDDQPGFPRIEDIRRRQAGGVLAPPIEDGLGAAIGEKILAVAGIRALPPACQFLPAISHPRIFAAECLAPRVWIG